jgi:5-formyltetrahydrofolate cyclo-ligase
VNKDQARQELRRRLEALDAQTVLARSQAICAQLSKLEEFRAADPIMLYMATAGEVQTAPLAQMAFSSGRRVLVPKVDWSARKMMAVEIRHWTRGIVTGRYGIQEPALGEATAIEEIDFVVVPAMALDRRGLRLGRGGGFYDRFLSQPGFRATTCGVVFSEQLCNEVPAESHDVPVDLVVTDREILRFDSASACGRAKE